MEMTEILLKVKAQGTGGTGIQNPVAAGDIYTLLQNIASYLITIAIPVVLIMILWGAFLILTSAGDTEKVKKGRQAIIYAIVGLIFVLISTGIPMIIQNLLGG